MKDKARKGSVHRYFRFADVLVVLLCLTGAAISFNLFRLDLFAALAVQNEEPLGTIIVRDNVVQRRLINRTLWERIATGAPVYSGDLIRVADLSFASIDLGHTLINLNKNTLIQIQRGGNQENPVHISLDEGELTLASSEGGGGITLNLMGRRVEVDAGSVMNARVGSEGMAVIVNEGSVLLIEDGQERELVLGMMLALDAEGAEVEEPAAVVTSPQSDARFLKSSPLPLPVTFDWVRQNLEADAPLQLELSSDRNFNRIIHTLVSDGNSVQARVESGTWHWRLSFDELVLASGRFLVSEARGTELISPIANSRFRFQSNPPPLRFQWAEVPNAQGYVLQVAPEPDFAHLEINRQVASTFLVDSSLQQGTWYWRVMPVFPIVFEGRPAFSPYELFHIERETEAQAASSDGELGRVELVLELPAEIQLSSPLQGATIAGLSALREETVFRWNSSGDIEQSRFILSRNSNPLSGLSVADIRDPVGGIARIDCLEEGLWYWTVETRSPSGRLSSASPRQFRVLPIPLLPAPGNLLPAQGFHIGIETLRRQRTIDFSWTPVADANAYIFALYQETPDGRKEIIRTAPENRTRWTLENISVLDRGNFIWQVEAVNVGAGNAIEQRGVIAERNFSLDIPLPGPVRIQQPGTANAR